MWFTLLQGMRAARFSTGLAGRVVGSFPSQGFSSTVFVRLSDCDGGQQAGEIGEIVVAWIRTMGHSGTASCLRRASLLRLADYIFESRDFFLVSGLGLVGGRCQLGLAMHGRMPLHCQKDMFCFGFPFLDLATWIKSQQRVIHFCYCKMAG